MKSSLLVAATATSCAHAFVPAMSPPANPMALNMGLFDGVKEAFVSGGDGTGDLSAERETPIDRWMGWNAKSTDGPKEVVGSKGPVDFIDSMDAKNYVATSLSKPMGIVFEENDSEFGGIFVLEVSEGSSAESNGIVRPGDQLVSAGGVKVSGMQFDEALAKIVESTEAEISLLFFRGPAKFLYGPAGASREWLDEFIKGGKVDA